MGNVTNILLVLLVGGFIGWAYSSGYTLPSTRVETGPKICYYEYADASIPAPRSVDRIGLPKSWHNHIEIFLNSTRPSPSGLPDDIRRLPDLSGAFDVRNLHAVMADDRDLGSGRLFSAVTKLYNRKAGDLFTGTDEVRAEIRDILFLWFGVADIEPSSRGWFIDARMLAFLEKLGGEKFVQAEWFPNPMPMASTALKDIFNNVLDLYYARLVNQLVDGEFYAYTQAKGGKTAVIAPAALERLVRRGASLGDDRQRTQYWCNVMKVTSGVVDAAPRLIGSSDARSEIDAAIRKSSSALSLKSVNACTERKAYDMGDWIWLYGRNRNWRDRLGRRIVFFDILYTVYKAEKRGYRHICYMYAETSK